MTPMRVALADDSVLLREGLCRESSEGGVFEVVAQVGDANALHTSPSSSNAPTSRSPTSHAANPHGRRVRADDRSPEHPSWGIRSSRRSSNPAACSACSRESPAGFGYLLEATRVLEIDDLADAVRNVGPAERLVEPAVIAYADGAAGRKVS